MRRRAVCGLWCVERCCSGAAIYRITSIFYIRRFCLYSSLCIYTDSTPISLYILVSVYIVSTYSLCIYTNRSVVSIYSVDTYLSVYIVLYIVDALTSRAFIRIVIKKDP